MPKKSARVDILDVGTGPGPSMFALSDYYTSTLDKRYFKDRIKENNLFSISYVERSEEFRNWLHHFTEFVNSSCPSEIPWLVPYHHGTFHDFQGLEFDQYFSFYDRDNQGRTVLRSRIEKYRFDIIVFSNFLTTKEQVESYSNELKNCVRFLRNNGILIVVGAKGNNVKYHEVYEEISKAILTENYSNHKFIAKCEKINIPNTNMSYKWNDRYGKTLKQLLRDVYAVLQHKNEQAIPPEIVKKFNETLQANYARSIEWEVHVFRKKARMRLHKKSRPGKSG